MTENQLPPLENITENNNNTENSLGQYAKNEFWDVFYENKEDPIEWYIRYSDMSEILNKYMNIDSKILHAGAGSSSM
jgi:hypothetical protein